MERRPGRWLASLLSALLCIPWGMGSAAAAATAEALPPAKPRIALTFDDGPSARYTGEILDILAEYGVKATFFAVGVNAEKHPDLLRRVAAEGHEIGNHTYSHPHLQKMDEAKLAEELTRTAVLIESITGKCPTLFRPPEGVVTASVKTAALQGGYRLVLWTIDTRDWAKNAVGNIVSEVKAHVADGAIILFHDWVAGDSPTPAALRRVIPYLLEQGYDIVPVSALADR